MADAEDADVPKEDEENSLFLEPVNDGSAAAVLFLFLFLILAQGDSRIVGFYCEPIGKVIRLMYRYFFVQVEPSVSVHAVRCGR